MVEVIIASDHHGHDVTALFHKRNVSDYFGIEGKRVELTGYAREDQPHLLQNPQPLDHLEDLPKDPSYTSESRTLRGSVYDLRASVPLFGRTTNFRLVLSDKTYFTLVECFFLTDEERGILEGIKLGDEILIHGCVTFLDGKPVIMVSPNLVEAIVE